MNVTKARVKMSEVKSYDMQHACMKEADGGKYVLRKEWEQLRSALREGIETRNLLNEKITTIQRERDELKKQRDELQAIVDKLPRTADGKPIASGMTLYRETRRTGTVEPHIVSDDVRAINEDLFINWPVSECYSTREAAEAAKGGEG